MRRTAWTAMLATATALAMIVPAQAVAQDSRTTAGSTGKTTLPHIGSVPLSADQITRSNGTVSTARLLRDSQGRTRVESGTAVTITDPATKITTRLDLRNGTFQQSTAAKPGPRSADVRAKESLAGPARPLGTTIIEGVRAEGRAYTLKLPAMSGLPARTKQVTVWLSTDLQLALTTRIEDASGYLYEQSYANIRAGVEPPADLFAVPAGFRSAAQLSGGAGVNADCPLDNFPDPLVLNSYGSYLGYGYVVAQTDGSIGCFFARDAAVFEYPMNGGPMVPLFLTFDEWIVVDTGGGGLPYLPWVAFGDIGFLVVNKDDQTVKDSLVVLTVWCC